MRVSGISFKSAYISKDLQKSLSNAQKTAIYNLSNELQSKHIIVSEPISGANVVVKQILFRINSVINAYTCHINLFQF